MHVPANAAACVLVRLHGACSAHVGDNSDPMNRFTHAHTHSPVPPTVSSAAIPGFNECVLNNRRYAIGEVFHPVVEVDGKQYEAVCYDCTCQPVSTYLISSSCIDMTVDS